MAASAVVVPLAFDIWDATWICPHCGSDEVEVDLLTDEFVCLACERRSASFLTDGMEDETVDLNDLDRFDFLALFEAERVGGD
jgi:hypothetical protein